MDQLTGCDVRCCISTLLRLTHVHDQADGRGKQEHQDNNKGPSQGRRAVVCPVRSAIGPGFLLTDMVVIVIFDSLGIVPVSRQIRLRRGLVHFDWLSGVVEPTSGGERGSDSRAGIMDADGCVVD